MLISDLAVVSDISVCDTPRMGLQPNLGTLIQEARERDPKWTQAKLAHVAGVNVETIIRAEAGANLRLETFYKIRAALEEKTGQALRLESEPPAAVPQKHTRQPEKNSQKDVAQQADSSDNPVRTQDKEPRESEHMGHDKYREQVIGAYNALLTEPDAVRQEFARRVTRLIGELTQDVPKKAKNKRA